MQMSGLQLPGQVGIGITVVPGDNAQAVSTTLQVGASGIQVIVAGGLTKRQELAARFLPTCLSSIGKGDFVELKAKATLLALDLADTLLAATEPKQP